MRALGVARDFRDARVTEGIPKDFPAVFVDGDEPPFVSRVVLRGLDVAIEANLQVGLRAFGRDRGRDKNPIAPNDRGGVGEARNRSLPANILAGLSIPARGQRGGGVESARVGSAVLGPVGGRRGG